MKESHLRSIVKGATWRIIGTLDTIFLSYLFTHSVSSALKIGFVELFTKIALYYVHERIWLKQHIGQEKVRDHYKDRHWRSLVKGASWRFFGTIDTIIIAVIITHTYTKAFAIGFTEVFTKIGLFYLHERIWQKVHWGKKITS